MTTLRVSLFMLALWVELRGWTEDNEAALENCAGWIARHRRTSP